jgi:ATP-dependent Clp protease adapter protein ClpS
LNSGLRSAERHKSFTRVPISADDRLNIELINDDYSRKEFEYVLLGFKRFPSPDAVRTLCELVHQDAKAVIWQTVHRQISAPPAKTP